MKDFEETIQQYANDENIPKLDEMYEKVILIGTAEEKEILANGYYDVFLQGQYDNMCGKCNKEEWLLDFFDWLNKIKKLNPNFSEYNACMGYTFEMLEDAVEDREQKIAYANQSVVYFQNQLRLHETSNTMCASIANAKFRLLKYKGDSTTQRLQEEVKPLLIKAIHLERLPDNMERYHKFNGSSITSYLSVAYQILDLPFSGALQAHEDFLADFRMVISECAIADKSVYYHWADMLFRISEWKQFGALKLLPELEAVYNKIWVDVREAMSHIENESFTCEHSVNDYGHLFSRLAQKEKSIYYHEISLRYHLQGIELNKYTWTSPTYASNELRSIAHIYLDKGDVIPAKKKLLSAIDILKQAAMRNSDLQICDHLGNFYIEYAKLFEDFKNKDTLRMALNQYKLAEIDGRGFYSTPYYGQVKCYYHLNDFDSCIDTLQKCKDLFSDEYHTHDFQDIRSNKDFEEIVPLLEFIN